MDKIYSEALVYVKWGEVGLSAGSRFTKQPQDDGMGTCPWRCMLVLLSYGRVLPGMSSVFNGHCVPINKPNPRRDETSSFWI